MAFRLYILLMYIESVHDDRYPGVLVGVLTRRNGVKDQRNAAGIFWRKGALVCRVIAGSKAICYGVDQHLCKRKE